MVIIALFGHYGDSTELCKVGVHRNTTASFTGLNPGIGNTFWRNIYTEQMAAQMFCEGTLHVQIGMNS